MTKNLFSILRYTAVLALVASLFVISGCDDDDEVPVFNGTLLEFLTSDEFKQANTGSADNSLDSLVKYVALYPELTSLLSGTTEYTVFAPSNTAFKNLLLTPGFPSNIALISPDIIRNVLSYHFVKTKKVKGDLTAALVLDSDFTDPTASANFPNPQKITINANGTLLTGSTNNDIDIVVADKLANNGVVHIVESVMIPPSIGATLTPILGTMAGTILLGKDFTLLARLIARADAGYVENASAGQLRIASHLARPTSSTFTGATFFAPPNAVITAAASAAGAPNATAFVDSFTTGGSGTARAILLNHYVIGRYVVTATAGATTFASTSANNPPLNPLSGKAITVVVGTPSTQNPFGVVISNTPSVQASFRPIVSKDISHTNGFVQVFGGILQ